MWNMLVVILIIIAFYFFAPSLNINPSQNQSSLKLPAENTSSTDKNGKQLSVVDSLTQKTVQQINDARQIQQQEQQNPDNNN